MKAVDTSVVVAALARWHEAHQVAREAAHNQAVPFHALIESYSVLTRLPPPHRMPSETAAELLAALFPPDRVLAPQSRTVRSLLPLLVQAGVSGAGSYDGLIGLTASANQCELLTRDRRASATYRRLGVAFRLVEEPTKSAG